MSGSQMERSNSAGWTRQWAQDNSADSDDFENVFAPLQPSLDSPVQAKFSIDDSTLDPRTHYYDTRNVHEGFYPMPAQHNTTTPPTPSLAGPPALAGFLRPHYLRTPPHPTQSHPTTNLNPINPDNFSHGAGIYESQGSNALYRNSQYQDPHNPRQIDQDGFDVATPQPPRPSSRVGNVMIPSLAQANPTFTVPAAPAPPAPNQGPVAHTPQLVQPLGNLTAHQSRISTQLNGYGDDRAGRPTGNARPPQGIPLTATEILTFNPGWTQHYPDAIFRLYKHGWNRNDIAKAQLHAIGQLDKANLKRVEDRIQKQIGNSGRLTLPPAVGGRWQTSTLIAQLPSYDNLTADQWRTKHDLDNTQRDIPLETYKLVDFAAGVVNWPQGDDRGPFTRCIQYALANPGDNYTTDNCAYIISQDSRFVLSGPLNGNHDRQALQRLKGAQLVAT